MAQGVIGIFLIVLGFLLLRTTVMNVVKWDWFAELKVKIGTVFKLSAGILMTIVGILLLW